MARRRSRDGLDEIREFYDGVGDARKPRVHREGGGFVIKWPPRDLAAWGVAPEPERDIYRMDAGAFSIVWYGDEEGVVYGDEYVIPRRFWALWELSGNLAGRRITLHLEIDDKQLVCTQIGFARGDGPAISATDWRHVPLARLVKASGARAAFKVEDVAGQPQLRPKYLIDQEAWDEAYQTETHRTQRGTRRPDEYFQNIAKVYRSARLARQPPVVAVEKTMHVTRSYAGRLVMEARRRGFLEAAPGPGQAGERQTTKQKGEEQ